jgi:hypothetical protein
VVDFGALRKQETRAKPVHPREIHRLLPGKALGYFNLWDAQAQVLNAFHERRAERDLVIKLNTGGGKTIVGLLILQSYLNEGAGPALYVAPDKFLVKQVQADAERLGIAITDDVESGAYLSGQAIGIVNAWKLANGRSVFSSRRTRNTIPIGAVVIDDAHAALATTRANLSLSIPRENAAWTQLLELFAEELADSSPEPYADLVEDRPGGFPLRVPFWAWRSKLDGARKILRAQSADDSQPLYYSWRSVADILDLCRAVFSTREVTVTAPLPPIHEITSFAGAAHRVFLSATLADDSVLVTDFDAAASTVGVAIEPSLAGDIGERMILAPQEINPSLKAEDIRAEIIKLSTEHNTVVLVPSAKWADTYRDHAAIVANADGIDSAVERLTAKDPKTGSAVHVGLVVLIAKYDGVDLPQDACRVLVIDGLPEVFSPEDRLHTALRGDERGVDDRQVQRLEQGMGRGIRSGEDHCVVFLLGPRLAQLTVDPRTLPRFSPATRAQLALSRDLAAQVENAPLAGIIATAKQALDRDPEWVAYAKDALADLPTQVQVIRATAVAERDAFSAARLDDFQSAASILIDAAEASNARESGALLEQAAVYVDAVDPTRAQQLLALARAKNPYVLRPLVAAAFEPVVSERSQAAAAYAHLMDQYVSPAQLRLDIAALVDDLRFDPDLPAERFEDAWWRLGRLLGLGSQRPEHSFGSGPDNIWALGEDQYWVIEAKSAATSKGIGKRDMGQLGQSMLWFGQRYAASASPTPVMIHPSRAVYRDVSPVPGLRVVDSPRLGELRAAVLGFGHGLAASGWNTPSDVDRLLDGHKLRSSQLMDFTRPQHGTV